VIHRLRERNRVLKSVVSFVSINWKIFILLLAAGLLGVVAVLPYMVDVLGSLPIDQSALPDIPMALVVALALVQNGILLAVAIAIGLILSERIGLRMRDAIV
jgi:hypothetical protein